MWQCPWCDHFFSAASAWSEGEGDDLESGVLCPECEEFISNEELEMQDEN